MPPSSPSAGTENSARSACVMLGGTRPTNERSKIVALGHPNRTRWVRHGVSAFALVWRRSMTDDKLFRALEFRMFASRLAFGLAIASVAACGAQSEAQRTTADGSKAGAPELISGEPAGVAQFRSTVGINDDCTAAKVGARLFLTAAHCVAGGRALHATPPPEDFPPNDGLRED